MSAMTLADCVINPSPIAQDRFKILVKIFWRQVIASASQEPSLASKTKESDRGIARLREHIKSDLDQRLAFLEQLRVASKFSPSAQQHEDEEIARVKRFIAGAPKCCWFAAADWINRDFDGANEFLALSGPDLPDAGLLHLMMVTGTQLHRLTGAPTATMSQWSPDLVETMLSPLLASGGGGAYYLTYVIAHLLVSLAFGLTSALGGYDPEPESLLHHREARRIVANMDALWTDSDRGMVNLLATATSEGLLALAENTSRWSRTVRHVFTEAYAHTSDVEGNYALATKEAAKLRKLYERQQTHVNELHVQLQVIKRDAQARQIEHSPAAPALGSEAELKAAQSAQRLAEANAQLSRAEIAELRAEVGELQAFLELLMEAPTVGSDALASPTHHTAVAKRKVVVVGGHERVHSKLRKELSNAIFLHPDRKTTPDDFQGADLVLFCVNYCNHALTWTAYQEVRKQKLRSGYTRHVNIEKIIDDVRRLLDPPNRDSAIQQ